MVPSFFKETLRKKRSFSISFSFSFTSLSFTSFSFCGSWKRTCVFSFSKTTSTKSIPGKAIHEQRKSTNLHSKEEARQTPGDQREEEERKEKEKESPWSPLCSPLRRGEKKEEEEEKEGGEREKVEGRAALRKDTWRNREPKGIRSPWEGGDLSMASAELKERGEKDKRKEKKWGQIRKNRKPEGEGEGDGDGEEKENEKEKEKGKGKGKEEEKDKENEKERENQNKAKLKVYAQAVF